MVRRAWFVPANCWEILLDLSLRTSNRSPSSISRATDEVSSHDRHARRDFCAADLQFLHEELFVLRRNLQCPDGNEIVKINLKSFEVTVETYFGGLWSKQQRVKDIRKCEHREECCVKIARIVMTLNSFELATDFTLQILKFQNF